MKLKYALVNGERQEAQPKLSGKCICCDSLVIAKCGTKNIWHWAHKKKIDCDPWWENETLWHRAWKGQFPKEWQEVVHFATNGEKHIADVKTDQGLVIEFQHSVVKPEERQSREIFYKKMIWIVDGTRRLGSVKRLSDKDSFVNVWSKSDLVDKKTGARRLPHFFEDGCALLRDWNDSKVPVFFDFGQEILWCILPKASDNRAYVFEIDRNQLIACVLGDMRMSLEELFKPINDSIVSLIKNEQLIAELRDKLQYRRTSYPTRNNRYNRNIRL